MDVVGNWKLVAEARSAAETAQPKCLTPRELLCEFAPYRKLLLKAWVTPSHQRKQGKAVRMRLGKLLSSCWPDQVSEKAAYPPSGLHAVACPPFYFKMRVLWGFIYLFIYLQLKK